MGEDNIKDFNLLMEIYQTFQNNLRSIYDRTRSKDSLSLNDNINAVYYENGLKQALINLYISIYGYFGMDSKDLIKCISLINGRVIDTGRLSSIVVKKRDKRINYSLNPFVTADDENPHFKYTLEFLDVEDLKSFFVEDISSLFSPENNVWKLDFLSRNDEGYVDATTNAPRLAIIACIIVQNIFMFIQKFYDPIIQVYHKSLFTTIIVILYSIYESYDHGRKNKNNFVDAVAATTFLMGD